MIDSEARNKFAELVRGLASGLITNDDFEDNIPDSRDKAIISIFSEGVWFLYDDLREYKLKGKYALSKEEKSLVARCVLFLKTNYEYKWPSVSIIERLISFMTFGLVGYSVKKQWKEAGDIEVWPFLSDEQFFTAKKQFGYLGINNNSNLVLEPT